LVLPSACSSVRLLVLQSALPWVQLWVLLWVLLSGLMLVLLSVLP
jgi:hypothetical protein